VTAQPSSNTKLINRKYQREVEVKPALRNCLVISKNIEQFKHIKWFLSFKISKKFQIKLIFRQLPVCLDFLLLFSHLLICQKIKHFTVKGTQIKLEAIMQVSTMFSLINRLSQSHICSNSISQININFVDNIKECNLYNKFMLQNILVF
jgi:hypothetical protein